MGSNILHKNMRYWWMFFAICILLCGHSTFAMKCRTNKGQCCLVLISLSYKTESWKALDRGFVFDENMPNTWYVTMCQSCAHCPNGCDMLYQSTPFSCSKCALCCPKLKLPKVRKCGGSSNKWRKCKIGYELCTPDPTTKSHVECLLQELAADEQVTQSFDCPPGMRAHSNNLTERTIDFCIICGLFMILRVIRKTFVPPPQNLPSTGTSHDGATGGSGMRVDIVRGELSTNIHNDYTILDIYPSQLDRNVRKTPSARHIDSIPKYFHDIRVSKDDDRISVIAYNLCLEERVVAFFRNLNIGEARYIPQLEHWYKNDRNKSDSYGHIMLDILIHWCCKETPNNTLYKLIEALLKAGFTELPSMLIRETVEGIDDTEERGQDVVHMMQNLK